MPEHRTPPEYPIPPLALEMSRWRNLATPPLLPDTPFLLQCIEKKLYTAPYLKPVLYGLLHILQDMMDAKMEKRRKGVFGPPAGKQFVVHIDDLNMPKQ